MKSNKSRLGLGTAAIGRPHYINVRQEEAAEFEMGPFREQGIAVLDEAFKNGITYYDTAPGYGMAEQLIMAWLAGKQAGSIELANKWGYRYVANFRKSAEVHEIKEHSLENLNAQWLKSQKLLPNMKVYQIHSATFETGVLENEPILNRLAELKDSHGLKIGLTSSGTNQVELMKRALDVEVGGTALFDVFQFTYNVFEQNFADLAIDLVRDNKSVVIKEAMANGRVFPSSKFAHYQPAYSYMTELAQKYGVGNDAIALRFCMDTIPGSTVLSGAGIKEHLVSNLLALKFELAQEEIERLKQFAVSSESYWGERKKLAWN
ncbi:aldo/keto reductase [Chitinophagales bacterium]|nr:aldo/keto reductase [Chitinophagales bacterium]